MAVQITGTLQRPGLPAIAYSAGVHAPPAVQVSVTQPRIGFAAWFAEHVALAAQVVVVHTGAPAPVIVGAPTHEVSTVQV